MMELAVVSYGKEDGHLAIMLFDEVFYTKLVLTGSAAACLEDLIRRGLKNNADDMYIAEHVKVVGCEQSHGEMEKGT